MEAPQSITDKLSGIIDGREVKAAVFTTFNFEPDFFELDVIPELINQNIAYSSDERVKNFQVREALRESCLDIDVFYDEQIFMQRPEQSPQMEYFCHGVNKGNACFHAKNTFLLVYDKKSRETSLLVAAGSNNVTRAGWWRNIEVQHWEVVKHRKVSREFLNRLKGDVDKFQGFVGVSGGGALSAIGDFLHTCSSSYEAEDVYYYAVSEEKNLFQWLAQLKNKPLAQYSNWNLEIISPYFCEDPADNLHERFHKLGVKNITILLPLDEDKSALCKQAYFEHIEGEEGIQWGRWNLKMIENLGIDGDTFRNLHAKIYHFYNGCQTWAFIGSINFSNKATGVMGTNSANVESGFFVRMPGKNPMLEPIEDLSVIEQFKVNSDDDVIGERRPESISLPIISISYDWKEKKLSAQTSPRMKYEVQLVGGANQVLIEPWEIEYTKTCYEQDASDLEAEIRNSSFVMIKVKSLTKNQVFPPHKVMIQQTSWTHKPIDLPTLTAEQILAIYAGMNPIQRQSTILNAMLKRLIRLKVSGEITAVESLATDVDFFCEYAEIFTSFRIFKTKLLESAKKQSTDVDYYLTGSGMDSLPTLLSHLTDSSLENFDPVNSYLILLCAQEILEMDDFSDRSQVKELKSEIVSMINGVRDRIELQQQAGRSVEFFEWFEKQFKAEYQVEAACQGDV